MLALFFAGYTREELLPQLVSLPPLVCGAVWICIVEREFASSKKVAWAKANIEIAGPGVYYGR